MKKIGITGSLASGKTTASKILSSRKGPLFSADDYVKKLYSFLAKNFEYSSDKNKNFLSVDNIKRLNKSLNDTI